jgi:hypothetical protein
MALPLIGTIGRIGSASGEAAKNIGQILVHTVRDGARALGNATKTFATNTSAKATSAVANLKERGNGIVRAVSNKARNGVKNWLFKEDNEFVEPRQPNDLGNPSEGRGTVSNTPEASSRQTTPPPPNEDLSEYAKKSELSTVATTGNYNDLNNKPLAAVAVSGDYNDLINKPDFSGNAMDKPEEEKKPEEDKSEKPDTKKNEKEKLTERLTKAMEKVSSAFEALKRGFSNAKDEVSSGEMGLYGILGGLVGARNGWNAVEDKEKKEATIQTNTQEADDDYFDNRDFFKNPDIPDSLNDIRTKANGGRTFEERAEKLAEERGYKYDEDSGDYINTTNDGRNTTITKEELIKEVKEKAEEDYKKRASTKVGQERIKKIKTPKEIKIKTSVAELTKESLKKQRERTENGQDDKNDTIKTLSLKGGDIYDEDSGMYINVSDTNKANKDIKVDTKNTTKIGDTDIKKSTISSLDTQTGNTLSNNAMNLEKSKEKSVTIVNDSSVRATSQNTSAFPSPISVKNSDTDIKYFNNRI